MDGNESVNNNISSNGAETAAEASAAVDLTAGRGESKAAWAVQADRRYYWFLVGYLVALSALGSFVNDMYTPSLPEMCRFFHCSVSTVQLGLTMGMIGLGLGQMILGPVSDRYGRKPVLAASLVLFIVAAVVSVFSPTIHFFLWCRLVQGIGASGGYFLARTIPADLYGGRALAKFMAIIGAINGIAPASAPVLGGVTADAFGWKGIFIALAAFALIILAVSPWMKETLAPSQRTVGSWWTSIKGYGNLLVNRPFMIHVCLKGASLGLLFAYISAAPFILQDHYGFSQTGFGLVIGFNALFVMGGAMVALKFKPLKKAARVGALALSVFVMAEAVALYTVHSFWLFEGFMIPALFALGMIFTASNTLAMNEGRAQAGEASAVLGVVGYIVGAIVSPLVGIGDVLHSTAITFVIVTVFIVICAHGSRLLPPDLDK